FAALHPYGVSPPQDDWIASCREKESLMSDDLSIQGTLAETTVPDLIRSLVRSSETGIVTLEAIGRNDTIYFSEGRIIHASSSDPDMGLGEILLRGGELNLKQYDDAMDNVLVSRRIGAVLVGLGYLKPDELMRATERQASAIVLNAMAYRTGGYRIEFSSQLPEGITALPLSTERLILDGVRRIEYWSLIVRGVGRMSRLIEQVPGSDARIYHLDLTDEENHVYSLLSEAQSVEELCAHSYLTNFLTCRTLWGLLAVNLVQDAEGSDVDEKRAAVQNEYELEATVERYNSAFQQIFSLVFQKIGDHTYDFIDRVVLHLSPGTLPYLSGVNLLNEGRADFDQLLNNIIASGSKDHPAVVLDVLNELLYGWILEIRSEFGAGMEKEVVALAEKLRG
ncbi:MAG TPA: DUF4388 domain-containing protein, partial [Thermoanaerobaculia bacterium]|nr:DUF4388 domain-containing protein [Thermoanaerobaculia bacterium]